MSEFCNACLERSFEDEKYIKSIFYTDNALNVFFEEYAKRKDYENTLFVITGDHPMTEMPIENSLKRYHVPLLLYSPRLIVPQRFSDVVSHLDLYETLLAFLEPYGVQVPLQSASLGRKLKVENINSSYALVFMNDNRRAKDIFSDGYFLSDKILYKVDANLNCTEVDAPEKRQKLKDKLDVFMQTNNYVCFKNKILPCKGGF